MNTSKATSDPRLNVFEQDRHVLLKIVPNLVLES
jgi:hypothetical protein